MALIDLIEVSKKFGPNEILNEIDLSINERERIAIIGKNGGGKSTLMKILCGIYDVDGGRVITQNNISIQMLAQAPKYAENLSVRDVLNLELSEIFSARDEYTKVLEILSHSPDDVNIHLRADELVKFIESKDGWNIERSIEQVLEYFSLKEYENRFVSSLSGGEIRRVALGALILKKPDVLLLDEPTNHLDVHMVRFLENMLKNSKQTIVFISHDRYFIDSIATKTVEIEEAKVRIFDGGYANYLSKKQEILESLAKSHETLLKQLRNEEEWLRRGVKARLKRNEGRKERVLQMREKAKKNPGMIRRVKLELERASKNFNQISSTNRKKMLFEINDLSLKMGKKELLSGFNARVLQGERIAIVGRNGSGKSTLLKALLGQISPSCGKIERGDVRVGYFDQNRSNLDDEKSILELFCPNGGDHVLVRGRNMHVYGYLKNFLFPKEYLDKPIGILSGGEKNRVALALLFTREHDILVLDEPTNDLDIATINILEEYLQSFMGAIIFVSHDRYFVDKISNKLWAFEGRNIDVIHNEYSAYLEFKDELAELDEIELEVQNEEMVKKQKTSNKLNYKQNKILNDNPSLIETLEREIKELEKALSNPEIYQQLGIQKIYSELESKKIALDELETQYLEVLELSESI